MSTRDLQEKWPDVSVFDMIQILKFNPVHKGSLQGYFSIKIPKWGNFIINDLAYFKNDSNSWISFPAKKVEKESETKYFPYNKFEEKKMMEEFSKMVIRVLEEHLKNIN